MKAMRNPFITHLLVTATFAMTGVAQAVDYSTAATGIWTDAIWNPGSVAGPTANTDTATINSGGNVTINSQAINSAIALNSGATLIANAQVGVNNVTFNGNLTGAGTLTKTGGWSLILNGDNSGFSGTVNAGESNILFQAASGGSAAADWVLTAGTIVNWNLAGNNTIQLGSLSGTGGQLGNNLTSPASGQVTFEIGAKGGNTAFSGQIVNTTYQSGTTAITKVGSGTLTLSGGSNNYTGGTTVNAGTLVLGAGGGTGTIRGVLDINSGATVTLNAVDALGYNSGTSVTQVNINGGTLNNAVANNNSYITNYALTGGTVSSTGGGKFNFDNGKGITTLASSTSSVFSAPIHLRNGNNMSIDVADGAAATDFEISGVISEQNANSGITKSGDGTLALTNTNSYTGNTTVNGGTLSLGNTTNNTNLSDTATVSIASGATVNLNFTGSDTIGKLIINGETLSGGTYNSSTPIYGSYFTGTGSLIVLDQSGTWTSTTSGNWGDSNKWLSNVIAVGYGKTADFSAGTGSESITVTLDTPREIGNLQFSNANYTLAGTNALTLDSASVPDISVAPGASATVGANLAGSLGMVKTGPGTLTLTGVKTYTGGTTVNGGTLVLATGGAVGPIRGTLDINPGTTVTLSATDALGYNNTSDSVTQINIDGGTLDNAVSANNSARASWTLTGGTMTSSGGGAFNINYNSSGGNTITSNPSAVSSVISAPITLRDLSVTAIYVADGAAATDLLISGAIGEVSGNSCGIAKYDTGKLVLSGANTYTGNTTVNEGILELASTSQLQFVVTDAPASNMVTGAGTATFNGSFNINTAGVSGTAGHIWLLVDRANLTDESFGTSFSVAGFDDSNNDGIWTMTDAKGNWSFDEATGELTLDIGSDYDTWKSANGVTGGPNDDDDNDGLTNHEEYAFGLDPTGGSSVNPIASPLNKSNGKFSYTRRATPAVTGLTYTVWTSTDLVTWTEDTGATTSQTVTGTVGEVETVEATVTGTLPLTASKLFIQVRAN